MLRVAMFTLKLKVTMIIMMLTREDNTGHRDIMDGPFP